MKNRKKRNLIVLIHPGELSDEYPYAPFELLFLAGFVEGKGFDVMIIDQRTLPDWEDRIRQVLDEILWVGITVITGPKILYALDTAKKMKALDEGIPVVFGGWHPTFVPEQTIMHPLVDYVVCGMGELKVVELSEFIRNGEKGIIGTNGVLHKRGTTSFELQKESFDWGSIKPSYHLIDIEAYRSKNNIAGVISARGCPFQCSFCTIAKTSYINRDVEAVVDEVEYLVGEKKFSFISYADGHFFALKKRVMQIVEMTRKRGLVFQWSGNLRPNTLRQYDDSEIQFLKESGLVQVFTGAETGSPEMLKRINKGTTVDDMLHLAEVTGRNGIKLSLTILCGLPHETVDDLKNSIDMINRIKELNPDVKILNPFYRPIPGSEAYLEMVRLGWNVPQSLEEWARRTKWGIDVDEVEPFLWMTEKEFDQYIATFKNSILNEIRVTNVLDRQ